MIDLEKIRVHETINVRVKKSIPILSELLKSGQKIAIYYEQAYHNEINKYIRANYDDMFFRFSDDGIVFVYLPHFLENLDEYIQYNFPDTVCKAVVDYSAEDFYRDITENIIEIPPTGRPMLLVSKADNMSNQEDDTAEFLCYDLDYADDHQFGYAIRHYLPPYRVRHGNNSEISDSEVGEEDGLYGFDADKTGIELLSREFLDIVDKLYAKGAFEALIQKLLSLSTPKPSRLLVTEDFRLLLPDYNNREVKIPELHKAVYFLFLRHVDGIRFKELCDFRDELYDIYCLVSSRENVERMARSIDNIVDCHSNSINEKCSRIKGAFEVQITPVVARQYYIDGHAGEPKRIALDRSLVEDRSGLIM